MSDTIINNLPWYITRAAAITAYILLFLQIVMGESMASGVAYKFITPPRAWLVHKYLGISFAVALLTHIGSLLFDNLLPFSARVTRIALRMKRTSCGNDPNIIWPSFISNHPIGAPDRPYGVMGNPKYLTSWIRM